MNNPAATEASLYPCEEHGEISVPFSELYADGFLDIYEDVAARGLIDISHRQGRLVVRATKFIGLIPLSRRVMIHVRPKVAIASVTRMLQRSGVLPAQLSGHTRNYDLRPGELDSPETLYREVFLEAMNHALRTGLLKEYHQFESDREKRGAPMTSRTVSEFYSRGIRYRHWFRQTRLSTNNLPNQLLKIAAQRLHQAQPLAGARGGQQQQQGVSAFLQVLSSVAPSADAASLLRRTSPDTIRRIAGSHPHYEQALWIAYAIASNAGLTIEQIGPARLESLLVDMSVVFEGYIRAVCDDAAPVCGHSVHNGNREQQRLFLSGQDFPIRPDIFFRRNGRIAAIADAKYKPKVSEADRYEILAYCAATGATHAAFLCPRIGAQPDFEHLGRTAHATLSIVRIDLGAPDAAREEQAFLKRLETALGFVQVA